MCLRKEKIVSHTVQKEHHHHHLLTPAIFLNCVCNLLFTSCVVFALKLLVKGKALSSGLNGVNWT